MSKSKFIPFWGALKEDAKQYVRVKDYDNELSLFAKTKLDIKGFPTQRLVEMYCDVKLKCGKGIIFKYGDDWIASNVTFTGELTPMGFLKDAIGYTYNGHTVEFKDWQSNEDCVVFFNNRNWSPDYSIGRYSDGLNQVDISEELLVKWSRIKPLLLAKDEKTKKALDIVVKDLEDGVVKTIIDERIAKFTDSGDAITSVPLTDPADSQWLQYLSNYRADLFSRFLFTQGYEVNQNTKMSQMTVAEVTSGDEARMVLPEEELLYAQMMADECNKKFGWNCTVEFSHCLKHSHQGLDGEDENIEDDENVNDLDEDIEGVEDEENKRDSETESDESDN